MPTGPSTTQTPYLIGLEPNVTFTSIASAGDALALKANGQPYRMVGVPDGLGVLDNGDGTISVMMNHEIGATSGFVRDHGSKGSFVSLLTVSKATLQVTGATDLAKNIFLWDTTSGSYVQGTTAFTRFCSGDLPAVSAFFDAATGLGTQTRFYLTGEESGPEGRPMVFEVTGALKGSAFELPRLGNTSFENLLASPFAQTKTIVAADNDASPGQVYFYVGNKQSAGTDLDKAGLTNGLLYGVKVDGLSVETATTPDLPNRQANFTLAALGNISANNGAQVAAASDAAGVTKFFRPEDGAWDPSHPNWYYFVTTANITSNSRMWRLEFNDIKNPEAGGVIKEVLTGAEGHRMLDNITVTADGRVVALEDVGNDPRVGLIWEYNPATSTFTSIGGHDPARFAPPAAAPFNIDEESSGVIDVTSILGNADRQAFLLDVQAHYTTPNDPEIVEGGQLLAMFVSTPKNGGAGNDVINGGADVDVLSGGAGDDVIRGGSKADTLNGDDGNDIVEGGAGADRLTGGAGLDTFRYMAVSESTPAERDLITDFATGQDRIDLTALTLRDVSLVRSGASTVLFANSAQGVFSVAATGDVNVSDLMLAQSQGVYMLGDAGRNTLTGGAGSDGIDGGGGDDVIIGGGGADTLLGGVGADTFAYLRASDSSAQGYDIIRDFNSGEDRIDLSALNATSTAIVRQGAATFIFAATPTGDFQLGVTSAVQGSDLINAPGASYLLVGDSGFNTLSGGAGADILIGGGGGDRLTGGAGADVFRYAAVSDSTVAAPDFIFDFQSGIDKIDLRSVHSVSGNDAYGSMVVGGNTLLFVDLNRDGSADMLISLQGFTGLQTTDILF